MRDIFCDDYISRKAALEGIRNLYPDIPVMDIMGARRKWLEKYAPYFECENVVEQLPSVTPQENITEFADRCKECGARYGKLLKQKTAEWIPVSERLPEENKTVIASTKYGVYPETRYTKEYGWEWAYEAGADYWRELDEVEAWMPLPKRYKPESEVKND